MDWHDKPVYTDILYNVICGTHVCICNSKYGRLLLILHLWLSYKGIATNHLVLQKVLGRLCKINYWNQVAA